MGAYAPAGFRNKKAPKFFSNFGANIFMHCILAPLGKPKVEIGTEYPDLVRGLSPILSAKPSPLPRVTAPPRRRKKHTPYSAVSASGNCTPFLCTRANPARAVFLNMPIFICKLIMNLLSDFVNIFTQKIVKIARAEARRPVLILSAAFCLRAHGAGAKCGL